MKPAMCRVKHDPENGQYGDCLRACIATITADDAEDVPHFAHDNPTGEVAIKRVREWLGAKGYTVFQANYPGTVKLTELLTFMDQINPGVVYMLFGRTIEGGDHVVVAKGGKIDHDPAWFKTLMVEPPSHGEWQIWLVSKL